MLGKIDLKSMTLEEMKIFFKNMGEKEYRADQTFGFIHKNMCNSIRNITVLPNGLKDKLEEEYTISNINIIKRYDSKIDNTKKYLLLLEDNNIIESVAMEYKHGLSLCVSTQVGCRMGCNFCASTKEGLVRDLTSGEILNQVYATQLDLNTQVNNIVLMGSGEPLDNYDNVIKFLNILHDEKGRNLSYRNMTLSTCGIVPKVYNLADEDIPITLSISLHSPFDEIRKNIMPIGKKYSIMDIIKACDYYVNKTNRRITFEYTLIEGTNDRKEDLEELIRLLKDKLCHINLIPLNPIKEFDKNSSKITNVENFKEELNKHGISTTIRREMGSDINAACGQLRRSYIQKNHKRNINSL
ncbi:MAG TPA: 23S rRNA (adenine(2503)-C(2))-methyltransferase RlmN [Tissierellales bacterium]|nr:23S rRNA (adenine(2503)-C(2))-methyltransferase RlmN [Tissierellales bacterium]